MSDATRYAGFWVRVVAALIDTALFSLLVMPILVSFYGQEQFYASFILPYLMIATDPEQYLALTQSEQGGGLLSVLFKYVIPAVIIIVFWIYRSATPGKMLLKLEIVDAKTFGKPSGGQFIGRYLGYYVSVLLLFSGLIWVAFDRRKQGFHDKLAGTVVIKAPGDNQNEIGVQR